MAATGSIVSFCGARPKVAARRSAACSPSSCSSDVASFRRRRVSARCSSRRGLPPMPPLNPRDPFLSKLASLAAASPEAITSRSESGDPDLPPYLDLFDSPKLMATPAQVY